MSQAVLPSDRPVTIETAIRTGAEAFDGAGLSFAHGTASAIDEASWLVLEALGLSPLTAPEYARVLNEDELSRCNAWFTRRIDERRPAAYLTGNAWFAGHRFLADERALIPRSPLAEFIEYDFFGALPGAPCRVLDLCTGGGCIAIACAYALPDAQIDASDISADALALAAENVALHDMQDRVRLLEGSLFEPVDRNYAMIISNPPYVDASDLAAMPAEFSHEPQLGLAAGTDGLQLVYRILESAARHLIDHGVLVVEAGNSAEALVQACPDVPFHWLDFQHGGDGVFLLYQEELLQHASAFTR